MRRFWPSVGQEDKTSSARILLQNDQSGLFRREKAIRHVLNEIGKGRLQKILAKCKVRSLCSRLLVIRLKVKQIGVSQREKTIGRI